MPTISKTTTQTPTTTIYTTTKKYQNYKSVRPSSTTLPTTLRKIKRRPQIAIRKPTIVNNTTNSSTQNGIKFRKKNETRLLDNANIEHIISEASNVVSSHIADNTYLSNIDSSNTNLDTASNYVSADTPLLSNTNNFLINTPKGTYFNTQAISEAAAAKVLFSTDLLTPKFNLDQTGFGYFKPSYSSGHASSSDDYDGSLTKPKRRKPSTSPPAPSVEFNLETELAIANLPLQSSYASHNAQHYRRPPPVYPGFYRQHHHGAASPSQIELYNDDLRLQHETRVIEQLATNPHPADKGKYYQYLKSKEDEKVEKFSIREQTQRRQQQQQQQPVLIRPKPQPNHYHKTILLNSNGPAQHLHFVKKPTDRPVSLGLSHYKTQLSDRSYSYPFI